MPHDPDYSGAVASTGVENVGTEGDPVVGDGTDNIERRGFIGCDISDLPAAALLQVQSAQVRADQWLTLGAPFSGLGDVSIAHVAAQDLPGDSFSVASLDDLGVFPTTAAMGNAPPLAKATPSTGSRSRSRPTVTTVPDRSRYHFEVTYRLP